MVVRGIGSRVKVYNDDSQDVGLCAAVCSVCRDGVRGVRGGARGVHGAAGEGGEVVGVG